jgi:hypothetical protein
MRKRSVVGCMLAGVVPDPLLDGDGIILFRGVDGYSDEAARLNVERLGEAMAYCEAWAKANPSRVRR